MSCKVMLCRNKSSQVKSSQVKSSQVKSSQGLGLLCSVMFRADECQAASLYPFNHSGHFVSVFHHYAFEPAMHTQHEMRCNIT